MSVRRTGAAESELSAPLPPPMVEPIVTPPAASAGSPISSHLAMTVALRGPSVANLAGAPRTQAPVTELDYPAGPGPSSPMTVRDRPTGSTIAVPVSVSPVAAPTPLPTPVDSPTAAPLRLKLVVLRGQRVAAEYPIYEGRNTIGRFVDKPVDIDLVTQEPVEQVWCSRLHAAITFDRGVALVEDLNSLNGTWVNGARIHPGQLRQIKPNDVIQVGTVQMRLVAG